MNETANMPRKRPSAPGAWETVVSAVLIGLAALAAIAALGWWLRRPGTEPLAMRVPGLDGAESVARSEAAALTPVNLEGCFLRFDELPAPMPGRWPRFRGPNSDNSSTQQVTLADTWPESHGPRELWRVPLGEGHAGPAIFDGCVYLLDYDEKKASDTLRCLSLADGREIWHRAYQVTLKRNHGMSRTVPAVTDRYVVTIGPKAHVLCVDRKTGYFRWGLDLVRTYGTKVPPWYTAQCPLIDNDVAVIAPAGSDVLMIGVDAETGRVLWSTPNPHGWNMSHSSIMPMTMQGRRVYTYCAIGGIAGVAADGPDRGRVLWETEAWDVPVIAPSPVAVNDELIFVTAGYGAGSMLLKIIEDEAGLRAEPVYRHRPKEGLACEQHTPVLYDGHLFGTLPKDAGPLRNQFVCYRPDGTLVWNSGKTRRFGMGPFMIADGKFFVLSDDGVLTIVAADTAEYRELAQAKVLDGPDAWGPMALAGDRLLVRDSRTMICLDIGPGHTSKLAVDAEGR